MTGSFPFDPEWSSMKYPRYQTLVHAASGAPELRGVAVVDEWRVERKAGADSLALTLVGECGENDSFLLVREDAQDLAAVLGRMAGAPDSAEVPRAASADLVALQTARREQAEHAAAIAAAELERLKEELAHLHRHLAVLNNELSLAEEHLREMDLATHAIAPSLKAQLAGRRVLYAGGRPSSTPAIRSLILRHGGIFRPHDSTVSDDDEALARAVAAADLVVVPLDCTDRDSAAYVMHLCAQHGVPYVPMRNATVASFAVAMAKLGVGRFKAPAAASWLPHR